MRKNNIFADAFNYLIYEGKPVVDPERLRELDTTEIEKLILSCRGMADKEKLKIKNQLRFEIYRHRYFSDADWSLPEEVLGKNIKERGIVFSEIKSLDMVEMVRYMMWNLKKRMI